MDIISLDKMYEFLIEKADMSDFMSYGEAMTLKPISSIEYRDKIRGSLVGLAIGDAFGSHLEGQHPKEIEYINSFLKGEKRSVSLNITDDTEMTIMYAESLIIFQGFHPEDISNRIVRQPITKMGNTIKEFVINYRDRRIEWYKSGIESAGNGAAMRCAPGALINYGDYISLKMLSGMQAAITHMDQMAIASSILNSTAIAYLLNQPPYSLREKEDILKLIDVLGRSIKGIETKVYRSRENNEIVNLYSRISRELKEAIEKDTDIETIHRQWGSGAYSLESVPYALFLFLKNPNDFERVLKDCLTSTDTDTVSSMALTLAGAYIGYNNIPRGYTYKLSNLEEMMALSDRLFELSLKNKNNNPYRRMRENISYEKNQDEVHQLLWTGIKLNKEEQYDNAVKYFENLINKSPDLKKNERIKLHIIEAYEGLGTKHLQDEAFDEALKSFKKALAYDLNHPVILSDLAITYLNLDDLEKAERYARRAVEIAPEYEIGREVLEAIISLSKKS
ncbi:ADP-ribosylglycohydrolase family protein [Alkaliphilus peptidifermentans]|uniref:ADP-ribosylglycohydrolase n=1 Tax=Alkaliphilus peptidifermentans DSM 18978 TaxID=1120976 RepID=A0A1G5HW30_9FIRM|nr:ADP-ribosylglycohydrolase family protein [Alkaliphilus peptidifermentans]SCY67679.1 ADP-ribosylglycohydrolase [Alkaliphilus peptidifermentans DSM 18978]